jgi:hypothetical protein
MSIGLLAWQFSPFLALGGAAFDEFSKSKQLPARLPRLTGVAAIVLPSTATASSEPLPASPGTIRLGLRLVDGQGTASEFGSVQRRDSLISIGGIGHFDKAEASRAAGVPVGDNSDSFHISVRLENGSQLRLSRTVG